MHKVQRSSDRELENQGINNHYNASVIALGVCQNHEKIMELDEAMKYAYKELMKMNHGILQLLNVGLPNPTDSDNKFIGKEDYMNLLQNTMNSDLGTLPEEISTERISSCFQMNAVIDKFVKSYSNIESKYSLYMRLHLCMYNINKIELPHDTEWSALKSILAIES